MTVQQLLDLLDGVNPNYLVELDINFSIEDSFTTDPITKSIYLETMKIPNSQPAPSFDPEFHTLVKNYFEVE